MKNRDLLLSLFGTCAAGHSEQAGRLACHRRHCFSDPFTGEGINRFSMNSTCGAYFSAHAYFHVDGGATAACRKRLLSHSKSFWPAARLSDSVRKRGSPRAGPFTQRTSQFCVRMPELFWRQVQRRVSVRRRQRRRALLNWYLTRGRARDDRQTCLLPGVHAALEVDGGAKTGLFEQFQRLRRTAAGAANQHHRLVLVAGDFRQSLL